MKRYIGWGMGVVLIGIVVWLGFWMTNPKPVTESVSDAAKNIFFDAKWYEVLWMRWTAVDWILSLLAAGTAPTDPAITAAARFLLAQQRPDGAWGEAFASCVQGRYVQHSQGQVVQTAWAMLALAVVCQKSSSPRIHDALARAAQFLIARQRADGGWDRESLSGVFNRNCAINYDNYRFIFPLWALARFAGLGRTA